LSKTKIGIIGLGYVGLPLARLFAEKYPVIGFDIDKARVKELQSGYDNTLEVSEDILQAVLQKTPSMEKGLYCSSNPKNLADCNIYIITVPTPVDRNNRPILTPL